MKAYLFQRLVQTKVVPQNSGPLIVHYSHMLPCRREHTHFKSRTKSNNQNENDDTELISNNTYSQVNNVLIKYTCGEEAPCFTSGEHKQSYNGPLR